VAKDGSVLVFVIKQKQIKKIGTIEYHKQSQRESNVVSDVALSFVDFFAQLCIFEEQGIVSVWRMDLSSF
jgi:hypothetical protein